MYIRIDREESNLIRTALLEYKKKCTQFRRDAGALDLLDCLTPAEAKRDKAVAMIQAINEAERELDAGQWCNFRYIVNDFATTAFWFIKEKIDEQGKPNPNARFAGYVLEWNDCHEFPFIGVSTGGHIIAYNDDWHGHTCTDIELLEIAIKLQEGK
ncbi:MAG: hypothetical protein IJK99_09380 [Bacteroidales bacterium]|nr:hypothetical protein [Bacteroidales bacterium]